MLDDLIGRAGELGIGIMVDSGKLIIPAMNTAGSGMSALADPALQIIP